MHLERLFQEQVKDRNRVRPPSQVVNRGNASRKDPGMTASLQALSVQEGITNNEFIPSSQDVQQQ